MRDTFPVRLLPLGGDTWVDAIWRPGEAGRKRWLIIPRGGTGFAGVQSLRDVMLTEGRTEHLPFLIGAQGGAGGGQFATYWRVGILPTVGAAPGSLNPGTICNSTTTGGLYNQSAALPIPPAGMTKHIAMGQMCSLDVGAGIRLLYDRLWHGGNLDPTITTTQTIGSTALTRYTSTASVHNKAWIEIVTALTGGGGQATMTYTDQSGNAGQSGVTTGLVSGVAIDRFYHGTEPWLTLAATDTGVRAIADITFNTAATAGTTRIVIGRPLALLGLGPIAGQVIEKEFAIQLSGLMRLIDDGANGPCLSFLAFPHGGVAGASEFFGAVHTVMN